MVARGRPGAATWTRSRCCTRRTSSRPWCSNRPRRSTSLGAAIALRAVSESQHDVAKQIDHVHLVSPFASLDALLPAWALRFGLVTSNRYNSVQSLQNRLMGHINLSVYHGTQDKIIPPAHADELCHARRASTWSSSLNTVDKIDGMGHDPMPFARQLVGAVQHRCQHAHK